MSLTFTPPSPFLATGEQDISLFPMMPECTVAQAARLLDMSEACVNGLLDLGAIKYTEDGEHRLIKRDDLIEYGQNYKRKNAAVDRIVRMSQEMGLYDD